MLLEAAVTAHTVQLPGSFEGHATRLGYTVEALVWVLADDFCARPPHSVLEIVMIHGAKPVGRHVFLTTERTYRHHEEGAALT